ncbi:MAG TPA: hypothetical protein VE621_18390 [Bryobacteraceae bacterium]|nr:hypothetical protein [Bryobacteraceae bacterium]
MSVLTLVWVCAVILGLQHHSRFQASPPMDFAAYVWNSIYKDYVRNLFVMLVMVLGCGGLRQEQAAGTAGLTLSLPVRRSRLVAVRAAIGILEVMVLALVPAVLIPILSAIAGEQYAASQTFRFACLWACCGVLIFGLAQFLSTLIPGVASAWFTCFLAIMLYTSIVNVSALDKYPSLDCFKIMSGARLPYFSPTSHVIVGPLPWLPLAVMVTLGVACLALSARILESRDFS